MNNKSNNILIKKEVGRKLLSIRKEKGFNQPIAEKAERFKADVNRAVRRLYGQAYDE